MCEVCQFSKAQSQSMNGKRSYSNPDSDGALKKDHLRPGSAVSVDHFESRLRAWTNISCGKTTSDQYVGGCIFFDHASGYNNVEMQLGFSASETNRAKQNYEKIALGHSVIVTYYLSDKTLSKPKSCEPYP